MGIYNPEIPVQSAVPISVLLDNLAVPSEARIRSICFPSSYSPGIRMRLDGFPASALAARAASSLCCCSFQRVRARTADRHPGRGKQGTAPFWPGRHPSGPRDACQEQVQSGERLSGKDMGPRARGTREGGAHRSAPNPGEKQEAEIPRQGRKHTSQQWYSGATTTGPG